jgi:hypothetical protein
MNKRITIVGDEQIEIRKHSGNPSVASLGLVFEGTALEIATKKTKVFDAEGRDALLEALQCLRDTGSFAALSDSSAVPYAGKKMQVKQPEGLRNCTLICPCAARDCWNIETAHCTFTTAATERLFPLTPPAPRIRAYTPVEAAAHLGRELELRHRYHYLQAVYLDHVELSPCDNGDIPCVRYKEFIGECKWRDTNEPCGVPEPSDA